MSPRVLRTPPTPTSSSFEPGPGPALRGDAHRRRRAVRVALAIALFLAVCPPAPVAGAERSIESDPGCVHKPLPPVEVTLEPLVRPRPGREVPFRLVVTPRTPTREVRVIVEPAAEIAWVSGDSVAVQEAEQDTPLEHRFAVRAPDRGRHGLHVRIELVAADGTRWRRGVGVALGPDPRADAVRVTSDGRGGGALEYEAAPATRVRGGSR